MRRRLQPAKPHPSPSAFMTYATAYLERRYTAGHLQDMARGVHGPTHVVQDEGFRGLHDFATAIIKMKRLLVAFSLEGDRSKSRYSVKPVVLSLFSNTPPSSNLLLFQTPPPNFK